VSNKGLIRRRVEEEGRDERAKVIAESLLNAGLSIDDVCKYVGLVKTSVEKMWREMVK
jgi:hypothetical protein